MTLASVHTAPLTGRNVAMLLAGRAAFRGSSYLPVVALLSVWGPADYSRYASATGLCGWLLFLVMGVEKASLKLVPRSRRLTADLVRRLVLLGAAPAACSLLALIAACTLAPGSDVALYPAAGLSVSTTGLLLVSTSLQRLCGRPVNDAAGYLLLGGVICALTAVIWLQELRPIQYLLANATAGLAVVICQLLALPRDWWVGPGGRTRRRISGLVLRNVWMLGLTELLAALSVATCFAVLALSGRTEESTVLYLTLVATGLALAVVLALLRLMQPRIAMRLRGCGAAGGRKQAARLLRRILRGAVLCGAILILAMLGPAVAGLPRPPVVALLAFGALAEMLLFATLSYAVTLLENTDTRALTVTSLGALAGLAVTAAVAALLVPFFGTVGAMAALVLALAGNAAATGYGLHRHYADSATNDVTAS